MLAAKYIDKLDRIRSGPDKQQVIIRRELISLCSLSSNSGGHGELIEISGAETCRVLKTSSSFWNGPLILFLTLVMKVTMKLRQVLRESDQRPRESAQVTSQNKIEKKDNSNDNFICTSF